MKKEKLGILNGQICEHLFFLYGGNRELFRVEPHLARYSIAGNKIRYCCGADESGLIFIFDRSIRSRYKIKEHRFFAIRL